jgi:hypothetical protein
MMKRQAYIVIALVVLIGSMALAAQAQSVGRTMFANIPFDFSVGNKKLPAGEYSLVQVNPASDQAVLQLRSKDGKTSAMVQMSATIGRAEKTARLVFNRYGDNYFFAQAWIDGDRNGLQAPTPRSERTIVSELAGAKAHAEVIALARR